METYSKGYRLRQDVHKALADLRAPCSTVEEFNELLLAKLMCTPMNTACAHDSGPDVHKFYFCTDCTKQLDFEVEERAAILEYDANMPLEQANTLAPTLTYQSRIHTSPQPN